MPKLRRMSGRDARKILEKHGFVFVRQKGSHMMMQKQKDGSTQTVPIPDHSELKIGTLLGIIRQSGLPREVFETGK